MKVFYIVYILPMKKILILGLILVSCFGWVFAFPDVNGCCSHHWGANFCSPEWNLVCNDWEFSPSCSCKFSPEILCDDTGEIRNNYQHALQLISSFPDDNDDVFKTKNKILEDRERFLNLEKTIRNENKWSTESHITWRQSRVITPEKNNICIKIEGFPILAQGKISTNKNLEAEKVKKIDELLEKGDRSIESREYNSAIDYYQEARSELDGNSQYVDIIKKIDANISWAKDRLAVQNKIKQEKEDTEKVKKMFTEAYDLWEKGDYKRAIELYEKLLEYENKVPASNIYSSAKGNIDILKNRLTQREQTEKEQQNQKERELSKNIESARDALGEKAKIIESLVPIIKARDEATQNRIKAILEGFMASSDEYTRNVGVYLSYLLK